jgi:hypothetical protein
MDQDLLRDLTLKLAKINLVLLFSLIGNAAYCVLALVVAVGLVKLPLPVEIDYSLVRVVAFALLFGLGIAVAQTVWLILKINRAQEVLKRGKSSGELTVTQTLAAIPVGMPACITTPLSTGNVKRAEYFAVVPIDFSKYFLGLLTLAKPDDLTAHALCEPGSKEPVLFVGPTQSFIVCWRVPRWSCVRKLEG